MLIRECEVQHAAAPGKGSIMNFWEVHGIVFLLGLVFFPRITVLFFSGVAGGLCPIGPNKPEAGP